ncbi:MAG: NADH-quinone oxidoreductase subunit NuoG [Nitrospiraceae bacterium]|nr:NADH-quinone oxidoreductase subunit NuoG [Nitrospiraceae bacterium]
MITITINGKEIKLEKAMTVLEAARSAGIKIPTLCYHEQLEKYGGCRLCLVEVEKMPRLQTSCTLMVTDGMVVRTETEAIADVRRGILEFLLINHPLDCPYCDKAGECELQDLVEKYGPTTSRFREKKRKVTENLQDPVIVRNMERCVMCTRCTRMCEGVQGASAIAVISRGGHSHIEPFSGNRYDCEYCGNCVSVCPVGAIMSRLHRHSYRPWQVKENIETTCPYCGVGCTLVAQVRDDVIKRVVPKIGSPVNNGMLCSRGRFGYEFVGHKERLTVPLIKKAGVFEEATWEEAIGLVAKRLGEARDKHGSGAIAGIASPRCTNEDNYVFQKFMRVTLGTNNIDSTARMGYAGAQAFIENIFGQGATGNIISGLSNSDTVLVIGGDPTTVNPILGLQIRACSRRGGTILTVGHVPGLQHFTPMELKPGRRQETLLLECVVTALVSRKGLPGSNQRLEEKIKVVNADIATVAGQCGLHEKEMTDFIDSLAGAGTPAVVIGKELVQACNSGYRLFLACAISYLINGRIYLLCDHANEQGVLDMGCAPDLLPGYRPLSYAEFRKRYETAWKTTLPEKNGLNIFDMIAAAGSGALKAMYVMGENPVFNLPDSKTTVAALQKLEFLVVQDIFMTETARLADVVLPALSWGEKYGTFTNMERRIQRVRKTVGREGMEDWRIVAEISKHMSVRMHYADSGSVFEEITKVSPLHRDLTYDEIAEGATIYPYKGEPLRGATEEIRTDRGMTCPEGGLFLGIDRPLFHSGTLSRMSPALGKICPDAVLRINPETAATLLVADGDIVRVSTATGSLELPAVLDKHADRSVVLVSNIFEGRGVLGLMAAALDPVLGSPVLDTIPATVERVGKAKV